MVQLSKHRESDDFAFILVFAIQQIDYGIMIMILISRLSLKMRE